MAYPPLQPVPANTPALDRSRAQPGYIAPDAPGWNYTTLTLVANRAYVVRFVPSTPRMVRLLAFAVSTAAGSDDPVDAGIYDSTWTRISSSGALTGKLNTTGVKTSFLTPVPALEAGKAYYASISCGAIGTTAAVILGSNFGQIAAEQLFGTGAGISEAEFMNTAHPLPTTFTAGGGTATMPVLAVRE